jgi:hypothetical protein
MELGQVRPGRAGSCGASWAVGRAGRSAWPFFSFLFFKLEIENIFLEYQK